jgi:hypothetical protein
VTVAVTLAFIGREWRARKVPDEVRAHSIVVVDESGGLLARLGRSPGGGTLFLRAEKANAKVVIGAINDDAGLGVVVGAETRINLAVGRDGFPSLGLTDAAGKTRLLAGLDRKDSATLLLRNAAGNPRLVLNSDASTVLTAMDASGNAVV